MGVEYLPKNDLHTKTKYVARNLYKHFYAPSKQDQFYFIQYKFKERINFYENIYLMKKNIFSHKYIVSSTMTKSYLGCIPINLETSLCRCDWIQKFNQEHVHTFKDSPFNSEKYEFLHRRQVCVNETLKYVYMQNSKAVQKKYTNTESIFISSYHLRSRSRR